MIEANTDRLIIMITIINITIFTINPDLELTLSFYSS